MGLPPSTLFAPDSTDSPRPSKFAPLTPPPTLNRVTGAQKTRSVVAARNACHARRTTGIRERREERAKLTEENLSRRVEEANMRRAAKLSRQKARLEEVSWYRYR
jgi:hypothetical protein